MAYTDADRQRTLAYGNALRIERAAIKRAVGEGKLKLEEAMMFESVSAPPVERSNRGVPLGALLGAQRGWGPATVEAFCEQIGVSPDRPVWQLTNRQWRLVVLRANHL